MFDALVVTLREGVEAALVAGIILIYLRKTGREALCRWVYLGLAAGVAASIACAAAFAAFGIQEEAYEGWLMIGGALLVVTLVVWMRRAAKRLKHAIETRVEAIASRAPEGGRSTRAAAAGLFGLTFILILREGIETVLFLAAVDLTTDALVAFFGGIVGIALAVLFGVSFVRGTLRVDLPRFFNVTAIVLFLLAAQLLIGGLHELGERGTIRLGAREMTLIGPIVRNNIILLVSLLALPLIVLLVPGRAEKRRGPHAPGPSGAGGRVPPGRAAPPARSAARAGARTLGDGSSVWPAPPTSTRPAWEPGAAAIRSRCRSWTRGRPSPSPSGICGSRRRPSARPPRRRRSRPPTEVMATCSCVWSATRSCAASAARPSSWPPWRWGRRPPRPWPISPSISATR